MATLGCLCGFNVDDARQASPSSARVPSTRSRARGGPARWDNCGVTRRPTSLLLVLLGLCAAAAPASATVPAPKFQEGPKVVDGGLLWAGSSGGEQSIFLSTPAGTTSLASRTNLSAVAEENGWVVVSEPRGPRVGRIGHALKPLAVLRACPSTRLEPDRSKAETVARGSIWAIASARCLGRRPKTAELLVKVRLGSTRLRVIGRVPDDAEKLAVAGSRIALMFPEDSSSRVAVVSSTNARPLYDIAVPTEGRFREKNLQIDDKGDVLVTSSHGGVLGPASSGWWWSGAGTRALHHLGPEPTPFPASLWEGRIAFATSDSQSFSSTEGGAIDVLTLASETTQTIVSYSGAATIGGLGFDDDVVAWALESYVYEANDGCVGYSLGGVPELVETPLTTSALPIVVNDSPGARPDGPECIEP